MLKIFKNNPLVINKKYLPRIVIGAILFLSAVGIYTIIRYPYTIVVNDADSAAVVSPSIVPLPSPLDTTAYDAKLLQIANLKTIERKTKIKIPDSTSTEIVITTSTVPIGWPVKTVYPNAGALLPFNRIVAYYGNLYSKQMGVLGKYPENQMLQMLASTTADWQAADPSTRVIPALDYIAVAAQGSSSPDGYYNLRMPPDQLDKIIQMADKIHGIVFLDVQVGQSSVEREIPLLKNYLKLPQVNLAIDPEFAMHENEKPGTVIGTLDASDINFATEYLANIVKENNLPPKILVVHRFTKPMVTNSLEITPLPEVQIVMDMDGFGPPSQKLTSYHDYIQSFPVQFTGFKLFYVNDVRAGHMLTPSEVLKLSPQPSFIQYQ